jgi:hypothetical protein
MRSGFDGRIRFITDILCELGYNLYICAITAAILLGTSSIIFYLYHVMHSSPFLLGAQQTSVVIVDGRRVSSL